MDIIRISRGHSECIALRHAIQPKLLYSTQPNVLQFSIVHSVLKHSFYVSFWCVFLFKVHSVLTKISDYVEKRWQHLGTFCFYEINWQFRAEKLYEQLLIWCCYPEHKDKKTEHKIKKIKKKKILCPCLPVWILAAACRKNKKKGKQTQ